MRKNRGFISALILIGGFVPLFISCISTQATPKSAYAEYLSWIKQRNYIKKEIDPFDKIIYTTCNYYFNWDDTSFGSAFDSPEQIFAINRNPVVTIKIGTIAKETSKIFLLKIQISNRYSNTEYLIKPIHPSITLVKLLVDGIPFEFGEIVPEYSENSNSTYTFFNSTCVFKIQNELAEALLKGMNVLFRIYSGDHFIDIKIPEKSRLKAFEYAKYLSENQ